MFPDEQYIFQQDNDLCHDSISTKSFIEKNNPLKLLEWPSNSPDLSSIETVWNVVKRRIGKIPNRKQELWQNVQQDVVNPLYEYMPRRIQAVMTRKGK